MFMRYLAYVAGIHLNCIDAIQMNTCNICHYKEAKKKQKKKNKNKKKKKHTHTGCNLNKRQKGFSSETKNTLRIRNWEYRFYWDSS